MNIGDAIESTITGSQDTATEFRRWCKAMLTVSIIIAFFTAITSFVNYKNSSKVK